MKSNRGRERILEMLLADINGSSFGKHELGKVYLFAAHKAEAKEQDVSGLVMLSTKVYRTETFVSMITSAPLSRDTCSEHAVMHFQRV